MYLDITIPFLSLERCILLTWHLAPTNSRPGCPASAITQRCGTDRCAIQLKAPTTAATTSTIQLRLRPRERTVPTVMSLQADVWSNDNAAQTHWSVNLFVILTCLRRRPCPVRNYSSIQCSKMYAHCCNFRICSRIYMTGILMTSTVAIIWSTQYPFLLFHPRLFGRNLSFQKLPPMRLFLVTVYQLYMLSVSVLMCILISCIGTDCVHACLYTN